LKRSRVTRVSTSDLISSGVLEIGDGYRAKNDEFDTSGIPFGRAQNLNNGFDFTGADLLPFEALPRAGTKVSRVGDCVLTSKGSVGRVGFVELETPRFVYSPQLSYWRSLNHEVVFPTYLRYWLQGPEFGEQRDAVKGSTDMADYVNLRDQRRMMISLPAIAIQRKIAAILSAPDHLIEVNNRRIKLLEEMAQRLYREWFVDFRYPGHTNDAWVNSELGPIPRGWRLGTVGDLAEVNANTIRRVDAAESIRYIDIASVNRGIVAEPRQMLLRDAPGRARRRIKDGDIIWSTVRPNLRAYALLLSPEDDYVVSTGFVVLSPRSGSLAYVYSITTTDEFVEYLMGHATGAAYPAVTPSVFERAPIMIPPTNLLQAFERLVEPLMRLASRLAPMNDNLRSTRDLLLPRLISGEIDVADLDIAVPEPAA
jgi:type I restriction enzyme, S subunit